MSNKSAVSASDEIWGILKEVSATQKETGRQIKALSTELAARSAELAASRKETDRQLQKTDQQLQKMGSRFNGRWGALVEGSLVKILQARGIDIMQTHTRSEAQLRKPDDSIAKREFDIIAANGTEVVAVEVKTTLKSKDVKYFIETLQDFKKYFPRYKTETIYGAMAYLRSEDKAHFFAEKEGLFVIRSTGNSASITNRKDFKPKVFS